MNEYKLSPQAEDNYAEGVRRLQNTAIMLFGGYYEPKSTRDASLAQDICRLLDNRSIDCWKPLEEV